MPIGIKALFSKKNSTCEGLAASPSILIRRPSNADQETPRTPALSDLGSSAISWNRYPLGRETVTPGRAKLTTQPKLSGAQRGGFFSQAGKFAPVGVRIPHLWSAASCFAPLGLVLIEDNFFKGSHSLPSSLVARPRPSLIC